VPRDLVRQRRRRAAQILGVLDAEHAARLSLIALINATNRLAVITRQPGGNHQPDVFE
jgi:hypothetical protein